jgi:hypothetical protein
MSTIELFFKNSLLTKQTNFTIVYVGVLGRFNLEALINFFECNERGDMKLSYAYYMKDVVLHTKLGVLELYIIALVHIFRHMSTIFTHSLVAFYWLSIIK